MTHKRPFVFDGFELASDRKSLHFFYGLSYQDVSYRFREIIELPEAVPATVTPSLLTAIMQNLHLVLGLSYWKLTASPDIVINHYSLTPGQAEFWNAVYTKGLGEFFYRNNIDFRGLVKFPSDANATVSTARVQTEDKQFVGIGGGKDSLLAVRLLAKENMPYTGIVFETGHSYPVIDDALQELNTRVVRIKRTIDPGLYELNSKGVYNGHIPISAVYAFLGFAAACFYGYRYMIVSNERSANIGNVTYLGADINHQWSKSEEFERLFSSYVREYITPDVTYFSLLRPLNELQIVKLFIHETDLLPHFSSCNRNFTVQGTAPDRKWCGSCPKCAFVFSLLAAFLPKEKAVAIMGKNLFDEAALLPLYRQLLGVADFKPFECVGIPDEVIAAFFMASDRHSYDGSPAMELFTREVLPQIKDRNAVMERVLSVGDRSGLPDKFRHLIPTTI